MTLPTKSTPNAIMRIDAGNKDKVNRVNRYVDWLDATGRTWLKPDLAAYRDYLRNAGLAESSIGAHLSSIRSQYRGVIKDRDWLFGMLPPGGSDADRKARIDELVTRIEIAIEPERAPVNTIERQDRTDREQIRLTVEEANALLKVPGQMLGKRHPAAVRDTAMLAMMLTTGIREAELTALNIGGLRQTSDDELCLLVRRGKGGKQRVVPYGDLLLGLELTEAWLRHIGLDVEGNDDKPVFWSFRGRDYGQLRGRISTRRVIEIVRSYPVKRKGEYITVAPHDLRRTYARRQYDAGMDIYHISQNMGHTSIDMTARYIGETNMRERRNREVFKLDNQGDDHATD